MNTILIIDDSRLQACLLQDILKNDFIVEVCRDGLKAIQTIRKVKPCLILLDVIMPNIDGFQILTEIKQDLEIKNIPVILITSLTEVEYEEKGLLLGAIDYIPKPFHERIIRARVQTHVDLYNYRKTMENFALLDGLTGIPNRRYYDKYCNDMWNEAISQNKEFTLVMIDIDYFKKYNDTYGHLAGDDILRIVASSISQIAKEYGGMAARYGGEEFGIAVAGISYDKGKKMGEEIRRSIESKQIAHEGVSPGAFLTISIGGICCNPQTEVFEKFFKDVDEALYEAKANGRNRVQWKKRTTTIIE